MTRKNEQPTSNNRKVLLVDDNSINRRIMSRFLQNMELDVIEAVDGYQAIELVQKDTFSLIFMDIHMPGIDGYETTKRIRELQGRMKDVPIIAVTADAATSLTEAMASAGMDDVLAKPFTNEQLNSLLERSFNKNTPTVSFQDGGLEVFDQVLFESFYDDASLRKDIVETFLDEKASDIQRVKDAFFTEHNDTIYNALHYLKGTFSYLKATKILKLTQHILDTSKEGKLETVLQYDTLFLKYYETLNETINNYFKTL